MPRNRTFSQYINAKVGGLRLDSGPRMFGPEQAALNLATKIANWNQYVAGQRHSSWQGGFMKPTSATRVEVTVQLPDGTQSAFRLKFDAFRSGDIRLALQRAMSGADIRDSEGRRISKREIEFCLFRFKIDDSLLYA